MSNAMRYTPEGGWVVVSVLSDRRHVSIAVSDTGIGIATVSYTHLKTLGDGFRNLANRVAGTVVWDGSVDTGGSLACAEPCFGLIFGGGKAIDVCDQCANNLLRACCLLYTSRCV